MTPIFIRTENDQLLIKNMNLRKGQRKFLHSYFIEQTRGKE